MTTRQYVDSIYLSMCNLLWFWTLIKCSFLDWSQTRGFSNNIQHHFSKKTYKATLKLQLHWKIKEDCLWLSWPHGHVVMLSKGNCKKLNRSTNATRIWKSQACICELTVHFSLVWKNDFPTSTRRINGQRFLEWLLNIRRPDSFCIARHIDWAFGFVLVGLICHLFAWFLVRNLGGFINNSLTI